MERKFTLCAPSEKEREMWISGFHYVVASTATLQEIMKNNNKKHDQKLRKRTEIFKKQNAHKDLESVRSIRASTANSVETYEAVRGVPFEG